jgi:hypothetical protein
MKCILHIGTEKTGTSSLQEFLYLNRKILARRGYLYTKSAGLGNNRSLAVAAFNADRRDSFTRLHGIHDDKELIAYQTTTINALRAELKHVKGIHTVIFSSEHIQSRLRTDDELSRLKNILNGLGFDQISIVVYLRAPAEIANSLYSTAVKTGSTKASPPGPDNKHWRNICDHRNTLVRFRNKFGLEVMVPRIYSKAELLNGSIIDDFAEAIGLPFSKDEYVIPRPQNESMTVIGLEILRRINQEIPVFRDDQRPNILRGNIVSYVLKHLNDGDRYGMPTDLRRQYEEAFRESNEWVRSEYFPDRQVLFEANQIPCVSESSFQPSELDQIAQMISAIWLDKSCDMLGFYNSRAYQIVKAIWRQKRRVVRIVESLTSRWRQR